MEGLISVPGLFLMIFFWSKIIKPEFLVFEDRIPKQIYSQVIFETPNLGGTLFEIPVRQAILSVDPDSMNHAAYQ